MKEYLKIATYIIYISSFFIAILFTRKSRFNYMQGFYWYHAVAVILTIIFILVENKLISLLLFTRLNILSVVFHYCFLSRFISNSFNKKHYLNIFLILFYFFLFVTICTVIFTTFDLSYQGLSLSVANIGLVVLSLFYFNSLFDEDVKIDLYQEPSYWVITGTVLGMSLNLSLIHI